MANYFGVVVISTIVAFGSFMANQTYQTMKQGMILNQIDSSLSEILKSKANKTAVNHLSDQVYQIDTAVNRRAIRELYHELTHQPPEVTRGGSMSFNLRNRAVNVWNMPLVVYANKTE